MAPRLREYAPGVAAAAGASAALAWLGLYGFAWNDYDNEARVPFDALVSGHVSAFLSLAPAYGGSLVERAPFALLPGLWGGGELAVYRTVALPCLLAAVALGLWLTAWMRTQRRTTLARAIALGVCVANPLTLRALELGHPEELLGAVLCVVAVLLAGRGRPVPAGIALGLAIANKDWAVLALGPVLLALPARRVLCALCAGAVATVVLAPLVLSQSGTFVAATRATATPRSTIFQPWQAWWFFGYHGPVVHGLFGAVKPGYRTAPGWVGPIAHPLILALSLPLSGLFWWRRRRRRSGRAAARGGDALALLALLLLLRCTLDTWDTAYYALPCLFALLAWEVLDHGGLPLLAPAATVLAWLNFIWMPAHVGADTQAAFFLVWTTALAGILALWLYAPDARCASAGARVVRPAASTRPAQAPWAVR